MGALRAAGLTDSGWKASANCIGTMPIQFLTSDADVALLHADGKWLASIPWPMVNVWATISSLRDRGIVDVLDAVRWQGPRRSTSLIGRAGH